MVQIYEISSRLYLPGQRLKQAFGVLIVVMTLYKLFQILG
jgi:hypothetical protein